MSLAIGEEKMPPGEEGRGRKDETPRRRKGVERAVRSLVAPLSARLMHVHDTRQREPKKKKKNECATTQNSTNILEINFNCNAARAPFPPPPP